MNSIVFVSFTAIVVVISGAIGWLIARQASEKHIAALAGIAERIRIERNFAFTQRDNALARQADLEEENALLATLCDHTQASVLELAGKLDAAQAIILQLEIAANAHHEPDEEVYYVNPAAVQPVAAPEPEYAATPPTSRAKSRKKGQ